MIDEITEDYLPEQVRNSDFCPACGGYIDQHSECDCPE